MTAARSTNGAMHTGEILKGDLDVWTFTATAGERIAVHIGEIVDNGDFRRGFGCGRPTGGTLGDTWNVSAAAIDDAVAPGHRHLSGPRRECRFRRGRHGHVSPDDDPHAGADHRVARR